MQCVRGCSQLKGDILNKFLMLSGPEQAVLVGQVPEALSPEGLQLHKDALL